MDFYVLLGVDPGATLNDIKRAYKRLARRYHPDINPGDRTAANEFRRIAEAYATLSDPDRRRQYDVLGTSSRPEAAAVGFEGFDFSVRVDGAAAPTFGDLFAEVLQGRPAEAGELPERGADLHQSMAFTFDAAMRGGQREIQITRLEQCLGCRGRGRVRIAESRCPQCRGTGAIRSTRGHMVFSKSCQQCAGTGLLTDARCPGCAGEGRVLRTESIAVNVPPGLADGARIRIPGKGHAGVYGGEPGDLLISLQIEPHPLFRREGDDLHVVVPIAVHEAALGAKVDIPTIDGSARLRIPPGTQTGQRFHLRDRGVPSARTGRRGDLVAEVRLVMPKTLDERSKELLREFGALNGEDVRRDWKP
ncbi:MAG TPA: J domain-containing protein [Vicinamibacterales bacterium]|nr:J domain-containing protein [Vicinamibacterales bacterium]